MEIEGAVILLSGGASGLGEATARRLIERGARVVLFDKNAQLAESRAKELGQNARSVGGDVTKPEDVTRAIDCARVEFGRLSACVCCAGVGTAARTVGKQGPFPLDAFRFTIEINLVGTFNTARLAAAAMAENTPNAEGERGAIVMTASIAAFDGQVGQAAYAASKAGIAGMTLPMARDLGRLGIRVVTIAPGTFDTPLMALMNDEARRALSENTPFPTRLGRPSEFASLAVHILENPMLNGETIRLDGAHRMKF